MKQLRRTSKPGEFCPCTANHFVGVLLTHESDPVRNHSPERPADTIAAKLSSTANVFEGGRLALESLIKNIGTMSSIEDYIRLACHAYVVGLSSVAAGLLKRLLLFIQLILSAAKFGNISAELRNFSVQSQTLLLSPDRNIPL
jgi:hypothetical protein